MAKRVRVTTKRMIKEGRGQGHGRDYKPWLTIRDVPSEGLSTRIKGWTTKRVHHFLSNLELNYFYLIDWSKIIVDIREQYPLPIEETLEIAERLGIKHPIDIKTREPKVMTTDFLIDVIDDNISQVKARTVKQMKKIAESRTIAKFEIERTYWKEKGIDWGIVTENEILKEFAENVKWVHSAKDLSDSPGLTTKILFQIEKELFDKVAKLEEPLAHTALSVDEKLGLEPGSSLWTIRHLIASGMWIVDMNKIIDTGKPLNIIRNEALICGSENAC